MCVLVDVRSTMLDLFRIYNGVKAGHNWLRQKDGPQEYCLLRPPDAP